MKKRFVLGMMMAVIVSPCVLAAYTLVDDFESYTTGTYNGGSTAFVPYGGPWESNVGGTGLVSIEQDLSTGTNYMAFGWNVGMRGVNRTVPPIADGDVGTYYFRIRTEDGTPDASYGLSDQPVGYLDQYTDFEVQVGLVDLGQPAFVARNGGGFETLVTGLNTNTWYDVWVVVDNQNDTYDVYFGTNGNPAGPGTLVADDFGFRNGSATNDLTTFLTLSNNHEDNNANLDDIYYSAEIPDPPDLKFGAVSPPDGALNVPVLPTLEAKVIDVASQLDTNTVLMTLDGTNVAYSLSQSGATSTVSYLVTAPLAEWSVHTARVVAASILGQSYTNEWSFTITGPLNRSAVEEAMRRANDYFLANYAIGSAVWDRSAYHTGNFRAWEALGDQAYYDRSVAWGEANGWLRGPEGISHADAHCCGQTYIDLYTIDPQPVRTNNITDTMDYVLNSTYYVDDWWWIDAFYMAGPTLARLGVLNSDDAYFSAMYAMYLDMKLNRGLFDAAQGLWWRDGGYYGSDTYWGRGNGWVIAACARVLEQLPAEDTAYRPEFESMLQTMAAALLPWQQPDGFWRSDIIHPASYPNPETSCTAFFTYALAYGINEGILVDAPGTNYSQAVSNAWNGMISIALHGDGKLGYAQAIGAAPGPATYESDKDYAYGAFLLAGSEVLRLLGPPVVLTNRLDLLDINDQWRFAYFGSDAGTGTEAVSFDDSSWSVVDVPHTWNALDTQDGINNNYARGFGWYRKAYSIGSEYAGKRVYLFFESVGKKADVYCNGAYVGNHLGAYGAFCFDITDYVAFGSENVIAVRADNANTSSASSLNIIPQSGDFNQHGGICRKVHVLITEPVHITPLDYASPGVYLTQTGVSESSADLEIKVLVRNAKTGAQSVTVRAMIYDADDVLVDTLQTTHNVAASATEAVIQNTTISNPHLWNGRADPYLYRVVTEVEINGAVVDSVEQPLGFRYFSVDANDGFFLNGEYLDLHGVAMHEERNGKGRAISDADREQDVDLMLEMGCTWIRPSHYQHAEKFYDLCDENGLVISTEIPIVNGITLGSTDFDNNCKDQLKELIRQNYNHPSICFWLLYNELTTGGSDTLIGQLNDLAHAEDPTRPTTCAHNNTSDYASFSYITDTLGYNRYMGWYGGSPYDFAPWADGIHSSRSADAIGITEYGAGANPFQHQDPPVYPGPTSPFHPEEYQSYYHEVYWQAMEARPWLWCKTIWNGFDFAVDSRNEGSQIELNDKGMVTRDRTIKKDTFYWYKANWTTDPMVYITSRRFTDRETNSVTAKVYSNCDSVELFVNGESQGSSTSPNHIYTWPIALDMGSNEVYAVGTKAGSNVTDTVWWLAPIPPPVVTVVSPAGAVASIASSNDVLLMSVTASNPVASHPMTTGWSQLSGPGDAIFDHAGALTTAVHFSSNGIYRLAFTANNDTPTTVSVAVLVGVMDAAVTNGLAAWWKMDESGGSTASDSSGNGRDATVYAGTFTAGYVSNAVQFTSASSRAEYAASEGGQITLAGWVRCDTTGGGSYPRIINAPSCRLMFRFASSNPYSVGFATEDSTYGDWDSGTGTIALGTWYHVAVAYDRSSLANLPVFYINGEIYPTVTLQMPSGSPPPFSGTGYIGNNSSGTRAWNGLIDDFRIYDRILSHAEVQVLAANPPANLAPTVSAGLNQTVSLTAPASLSGSTGDDGNPDPPAEVTVTWSKLSGPGSVVFGDVHALATTAAFSAPGSYMLQLLADDGQVQTVSSVMIDTVVQPNLTVELLPDTFRLSWPAGGGGEWMLQSNTNLLDAEWIDLYLTVSNQVDIPMDPNISPVFYRLELQ